MTATTRRNITTQRPTTNKSTTKQPISQSNSLPPSEHGHRRNGSTTSIIVDSPPVNQAHPSTRHTHRVNQSIGMIDLDDPSLAYSNRNVQVNNQQPEEPPMITLADLELGYAPADFVPKLHQSIAQVDGKPTKQSINQSKAAVRHIKDEIDELFYALTVKDKEIRMSRASVDREVASAKRATAKLSRDVEDLTRSQAKQIIKQAQQAQLPIPPLSNPLVP